MTTLIVIGLGLFLIAGVVLWNRRTYSSRMSLIRHSVPTTAANAASSSPGAFVSVSGIARQERELLSEQTRTPCIYFSYEVVRRFERRQGVSLTNRNRQSRGPKRSREVVARHQQSVPFFVEDQSGRVRVDPRGAHFEARQVLDRYEREPSTPGPINIAGTEFDINRGGRDRTLGHEYVERLIPADGPVFVAGVVDEHGTICCRSGQECGMIVSHRDEASLQNDWGRRERLQLYGALGSAGAGLLLWSLAAMQSIAQLV